MVRPRGGRATPRYHHVRDAAENKMFTAIAKMPKIKVSKADQMISKLIAVGDMIDLELQK
jgi:hypothetical protein